MPEMARQRELSPNNLSIRITCPPTTKRIHWRESSTATRNPRLNDMLGGSAVPRSVRFRKMKQVTLATDGACIGNPGPGGWACILRFRTHHKELSGSEGHATNSRMELRDVIEGLRALHEPCQVTVVTDSQYVRNGITQWLPECKKHGWRKREKASQEHERSLSLALARRQP
jgi:ribonuclease HI